MRLELSRAESMKAGRRTWETQAGVDEGWAVKGMARALAARYTTGEPLQVSVDARESWSAGLRSPAPISRSNAVTFGLGPASMS